MAYQEPNRLKEIVGALKGVPEFISNGGEKRLARYLEAVRRDGFAINDRDLSKKWIRAIAIPIFSAEGVACALNIVVEPEEVSIDELRNEYAPILLKADKELSSALGYRG